MSGKPDPKPCACGCGRPQDRRGQSYRRECHARYMREYRASQKRSSLAGLAQLVDELDQVPAAELDAFELAGAIVRAAGFAHQVFALEVRLAELVRRCNEARQ